MLSASQTTGFLDQQYIVNQWIDPYIFLYVDRDARKKELDTTISATSTGRLTERNIKKKKKAEFVFFELFITIYRPVSA